MGKKANKVKTFVKKHKVLVGTTGVAIVGGVIFAVTKHKPNITSKIVDSVSHEHTDVPEELVKFGVDTIDNYSGCVELMTNFAPDYKVAIDDLGRFGEALCKIPEVKPENKAYVLINIAKTVEDK